MRRLIAVVRMMATVFWKYWKHFALFLGRWNTKLLLTLTYLLFFGTLSLVLKLLRKDLLDKKLTAASSYWKDKTPVEPTLERSMYQF